MTDLRTFDPSKTGRTALAIAVGALISIITLTLLYSGLPFFGPVNELTNLEWQARKNVAEEQDDW